MFSTPAFQRRLKAEEDRPSNQSVLVANVNPAVMYERRSKILQLDYIEQRKCYKLNFIFQYNLY